MAGTGTAHLRPPDQTILVHERTRRSKERARAAERLSRVGLPPDRFPLHR